MTVIHLLMHLYMHAFRELKILMDIIWALDRHGDSIGWDTFGQKLKKIGLLKTALITIRQIEAFCGDGATTEPALARFKGAVEGMGRREPPFLTDCFRLNPDEEHGFQDRRDTLMVRLVLDGWKRIPLSFAGSLFPPPEGLKELYGDRRNRMLPVHYWRFMKWREGMEGRKAISTSGLEGMKPLRGIVPPGPGVNRGVVCTV